VVVIIRDAFGYVEGSREELRGLYVICIKRSINGLIEKVILNKGSLTFQVYEVVDEAISWSKLIRCNVVDKTTASESVKVGNSGHAYCKRMLNTDLEEVKKMSIETREKLLETRGLI
jgi:hypothetical protein